MSGKGGTTLNEKIRKRRKALKESIVDSTIEENETSELELSRTKRGTDHEMSSASSRSRGPKEAESSFTEQPLEELRDAEQLMTDLKTRRAEKKKELSKIDKDVEEPSKAATAQVKKTKKAKKITTLEEEKEALWPEKEERKVVEDVDKIKEKKVTTKRRKAVMKQEEKTKEEEKIEVEENEAKELIDAAMTATVQAPTTGNINASIRERIKRKMNEVKEKAEEKVKEEIKSDPHKGRAGRKLRGLRDRPITTRFDDPSILTKEEIEEDKKLQEKITAKSLWRSAMKTLKAKESDMPTPEETEDFFSRNFEPESQPSIPTASTDESKEEEKQEAAAKSEDEKEERGEREPLLNTDYFDSMEDWKIKPAELKGVDYRPHQKILENERKAYYTPRIVSVPHSEKIPEGSQPRYLEDEGLYVGVRPPINQRNINIEEHRLLERSDRGSKWFGEDGRMKALPDPLKEVVSRPSFLTTENRDPALQLEYKKATMTGFDSRFIDGSSDTHGKFQVDVDINSIAFSHHALFSKENVLSSGLQQLYKQYLTRSKQNMATFLTDKIKALKSAIVHMKNQKKNLSMINLNASLGREYDERLVEYKNEIRQTMKLRDMELKNDRELLKHIFKNWKQIKELREIQGYVNTPVKISFRKEERDKAEDLEEMKREIEEELNERRAEYDESFHERMEKYSVDLEEWKKHQNVKKSKLKKKTRSKKKGSQEDLVTSSVEDLDEPDLPKPQEPSYEFEEGEIAAKLKETYLQIRRKPGEPFLIPELSMSSVITPTHNCPRKEQLRRKEVQNCKCYIRVLFNYKEVSRTIPVSLTSDFMVHFGDIFNIQIVQWPESIKYEVYEAGTLSDTLLAELYTPIPDSQVTTDNVQLSEIEFSSNQQLACQHSGVGSGVPFRLGSDNNSPEQILLTSGTLMASASWALGDDGSALVPPSIQTADYNLGGMKQYDALAAIGATGMVDMQKLSQWVNESHLDPNDPANASLLHFIKTIGHTGGLGGGVHAPDYFRLEQLQQEFDFCTDEEIEKSKRFRLIQLREQEIPDFKGKKIPAREREVDEKIFINYEKKKDEERRDEIRSDMDPHRQAVAKFLGRVREQVMARFRAAEHQYTLDDVVNEEPVPNISMISINLKKLAEPRRPLRPTRRERKVVTAHNLGLSDVKVIANIERAFNVPSRKDASVVPKKDDDYGLVRPFVEVVFQKNVQQTTVAEGSNPSWNEELQLPFKAPNNDYSTDTLQSVKDLVYFNLFDEVLIDILEDDRDRDTKIHKRREKRWLGSITIPFTTIYFQGRIEGVFRVEAPPVLLGYEQSGKSGGSSITSYLSLFITIEPALAMPEHAKEKFDTNEDERLLLYAENFQVEIEKKFPKRELLTTVMDVNGKSVFATRYFKPLKPPEELLKDDKGSMKQARKIAKFVSSIPFVSDSVVFPGLCDIWSTCEQFLQMLQGDEEEHAVLLCNYFLYLGKKAWVVIGTAIPEGPTSYVLTLDGKANVTIWNPSSGECFLQHDHYAPLKSIGCLIGQDNIWANIQPHDEPSRVNFDLSNTSEWKPFFSKSFPDPGLTSVQVEELTYFQTDRGYVAELQERIEKKLKEKLMEWRSRHVTRWNRYITQTFRKLLRNLEDHQGQELMDLHRSELESIAKDYNLCGFPLHITYTEIQPVIDAVFSTGVHWNEAVEVEFALAVHIHPYPNSVLSLWVYIASVLRKR